LGIKRETGGDRGGLKNDKGTRPKRPESLYGKTGEKAREKKKRRKEERKRFSFP